MKTLVELFSNDPYDDLLPATAFTPDTVVYICAERTPDIERQNSIRRYLSRLNPCVNADFFIADVKGHKALFDAVERVFSQYPDCAIDFTGGTVPAAVAAERYCALHSAKAFYLDYHKREFVNIHGMEAEVASAKLPAMSIPLLFSLAGACILGSGHSTEALSDAAQLRRVRSVIRVYLAHTSEWGQLTSYLHAALGKYGNEDSPLYLSAPVSIAGSHGSRIRANADILRKLEAAGAIEGLRIRDGRVRFSFVDHFMRRCLSVTGMWLELLIYIAALDSKLFDDVRMSVEFDWDGIVHGDRRDTRNEIDVLLIRGLTPIFVSCKSGSPEAKDLYEIRYLAERFGGKHACAAIATAQSVSLEERSLLRRAGNMEVAVIESDDLLDGNVARLLAGLAD